MLLKRPCRPCHSTASPATAPPSHARFDCLFGSSVLDSLNFPTDPSAWLLFSPSSQTEESHQHQLFPLSTQLRFLGTKLPITPTPPSSSPFHQARRSKPISIQPYKQKNCSRQAFTQTFPRTHIVSSIFLHVSRYFAPSQVLSFLRFTRVLQSNQTYNLHHVRSC